MRIHPPFYLLLLISLALGLSNCKTSQDASVENNETMVLASELYLMVRLNKTTKGLTVVTFEKKINAIQHVGRANRYAPIDGDIFRCDILDAEGKVILFRKKIAPFEFDGAEGGKDAIVTFFIPLLAEATKATIYHQTAQNVWQQVYTTGLP